MNMKIEAVKVRRLYLEIASQLENIIAAGDIKPGERLPSERDLAERFGVSRPTVREAMIALEITGLIEIRTGSGIYVRQAIPTTQALQMGDDPGPFEILEARRLIEGEVVALAADRMADAQLADLEKALLDMEREDADGSISEQADQRFHCIIVEASENSALISTVRWLWELRNRSDISTRFHQRVREKGVHPSIDEHRRIYQALKVRDAQAAKRAMIDHITNALDAGIATMN
jgi:GntR family transcriptional repressor for pyruvate dehydrogenase complex